MLLQEKQEKITSLQGAIRRAGISVSPRDMRLEVYLVSPEEWLKNFDEGWASRHLEEADAFDFTSPDPSRTPTGMREEGAGPTDPHVPGAGGG